MTGKRRAIILPLLIASNVLLVAALVFFVHVTSRPPCRGIGCLQGPKPNPTPGKVDLENIPDWLKGKSRPRGRPGLQDGSPSDGR